MNIVEPYAKICGSVVPTDPFTLQDGINCLRKIEYFGRISHRSEDKQTEDSWSRFITVTVMGRGDWSVVEHAHVSVDVLVDRGITHELVRHRLFSFTQESTRFVNYKNRQLTIPLLAEFKSKIPLLFDDIQPEQRQVDNLRLPR